MGCTASKEEDSNVETAAVGGKGFVKPTVGPPTKFYPYVMVDGNPKELGSGAYSTVLEATSKKTKQVVAVKKITKSNLQPHDHEALKHEVALLCECKGQANILAYIDFFDEKDYYYLVTEQIKGGELFDRICDKEQYNEHEARILIKTLLQTLAFLHAKDIAHRDLKPENLLLKSPDNDTQIVLADFGFATKCDGKSLNQVCGTPDYVAPEIIKHQLYDWKCDVWSAGVIAYILIGGYAPFQARDADDREELFKVIKRGKLVFHERYWKDVRDEVKDMISQMLTVDPDARPTATALLKHPWIGVSKQKLEKSSLTASQARIKEFNAKEKLKGAVNVVKATNRMAGALSAFTSGANSGSSAAGK